MDAVRTIAEMYDARRDEVSSMLQRELGAPAKFAHDVQAALFKYQSDQFLTVAESFPWEIDLGRSLVVKEPVGVVSAITPWNWPLFQIAAKVVPALLAGCSIVLKPSEVAPLNAFVLAEVVERAEADGVLPPGVFNLVSGTGAGPAAAGEALASHPLSDMVSFTGSTNAGRRVHRSGASPKLKRVRSELGGKSACVVLDDADPALVERFALHALENSGQTCSARARMIVPRDRYEEIVDVAAEAYEAVRVVRADDPDGGRGDIGPLASAAQWERVRGYIRSGIEDGARLVAGGLDRPDGVPAGGYFVRPTVFADVEPRMTIAQEEIFGPVLCIMPYSGDVDEAVSMANGTEYGLSGAVLGADEGRAREVARRMRAGEVFVNTLSQSPVAPFGGYGQSGDGRELGAWGLEEFLQVKAIHRRPQK
uniref:aldehyde dehydrogenase (NAD(+)) n=1 Tax=Odontella aurita TaxID=265563 RepID=A0A7S4J7H2_9STRA|mmetsp:Transcript_40727/g.122674  ORF Transcript_40727/g.122674 Transcript_40727/m.122674 type:complete len:423 (+) Transcript_40727:516-1784(+)